MGKLAFVFPGQGSQAVGMGKDLYDTCESARDIFDKADEALPFALTELIFNGPESALKQTYHTQPALVATSVAILEQVKQLGLKPDFCAGHSLGEYSALVAAGALKFEEALQLVHARGTFMDEAVPSGQGSMAAVLGAEREQLHALCLTISAGGDAVELANMNCPGQIVVSGSASGVATLIERASEAGAKRVVPLEVSGPFHSSLMKPAADKLAQKLHSAAVEEALIPVVSNVTARPVQHPEQIRELLIKQVDSPVLWEDSVRWMIEQGTDCFIEIGPGKVLSGLIRKIDRKVRVISVSDLASLEALSKEGFDA